MAEPERPEGGLGRARCEATEAAQRERLIQPFLRAFCRLRCASAGRVQRSQSQCNGRSDLSQRESRFRHDRPSMVAAPAISRAASALIGTTREERNEHFYFW